MATSGLMFLLSLAWLCSAAGWFNILGPITLYAGLGCSILAAWAVFILARKRKAFYLSLAALALLVYGLTIPLTLTPDQFALIPVISSLIKKAENLRILFGVQVAASFLISLAMWFYYQDQVWRQAVKEKLSGGESLIYPAYFLLAICLIVLLGGISTGLYGQNLAREMKEDLASRARIVAAALPSEAIKQLAASQIDVGTAPYEGLKRLLTTLQTASKECRFIYLLTFHQEEVVFLVDSEPVESPDYSPPGQIYQEASPILKSMAAAPHAFVEGPQSDRWGTWITAFEVIKDPSTGKFLALAGLDIDAREWQKKIALHKLLPINITLLMIILLTGFYISQQKLLASTRHLAVSEERYRSLVEGSPNGICLFDREGRFQAINRNGLAMLGVQEGEIFGKPFQDIWSREQQPRVAQAFDQLAAGTMVSFEGEIARPQGKHYFWHVVLNPIKGKLNAMLGSVGILEDITERKQAEEALRNRQAKLDGIFRAAPVGIGLTVDRVFKEVNDQVCIMTGYSREELLERNSRFLYPSQEEFEVVGREKYRQIAEQGKGTVETRWQSQDGSIIDVMLSSAPLFPGSEAREILFTAMDITERKKLEAARYTLDKMESLGIMAGGIAHDFNNVLMAILGNVSLVNLAATVSEIQERLKDAEQGCRQAMLLAKQLLTFARGGAPVKKPDDVKQIVQEATRLALSGSKTKTLFNFPDDLWHVDVDRGQMHQVFTNLLINADQAMPLGGVIHLQAENYPVRRTKSPALIPGNYVLVRIADQGVGIAPDQLDKIYDPYYSTKQKGSGLGLATVYSIIKQHGGIIACESLLGQGTTFHLYLPALGQWGKAEKLGGDILRTGHGRILILDDDARVRVVMGRMLEKLGYNSVFASEGQEALDLYDKARSDRQPFDLVILDLTIPGGMGGLETLRGLLAQNPEIKAIVSSGYADDPVLANFQKFGFRGVITKPYRIADLSEVIHRTLTAPLNQEAEIRGQGSVTTGQGEMVRGQGTQVRGWRN
jgi:PAS domain S-box-containing protein